MIINDMMYLQHHYFESKKTDFGQTFAKSLKEK